MGGDSVNGPTGEIRGHLCVVSKGVGASGVGVTVT